MPNINVRNRVSMNEDLFYSRSAKLLVVDDNPVVSFFLEQTLANEGYQVIRASNGREALDRLAEGAVDLILSDVIMPNMDGGQLCQHVRHVLELNSLPFIVLTAADDKAEMAKFYRLGIDDYLTKPCQPDLLLAVIRSHLERARLKKAELDHRLDRFRKRIINTLSHEFRTPLMAINSGAEVLLNRKEIEPFEETKGLLRAIQRGGERLERLVNDFMSLQQIEAGLALKFCRQNLTTVALDTLLLNLKDSIFSRYSPEQTEYTFSNHGHGEEIVICEVQIVDALLKLIDNSLKFGPREGPVDVIFKADEYRCVLSVQDRGSGFFNLTKGGSAISALTQPLEDASVAFGQLNRDIFEQQGGGLGLAIAKGYAENHGGELVIEERVGGGSVVSLKLPRLGA